LQFKDSLYIINARQLSLFFHLHVFATELHEEAWQIIGIVKVAAEYEEIAMGMNTA
jgi:hypothetical protein